jgi:hypothetical protein
VNPLEVLRKIWYWSYERGSWQYDVMCVLILAFIFLVPATAFDDPEALSRRLGGLRENFVTAERVPEGSLEALTDEMGGAEILRMEVLRGADGKIIGYRVWSRVDE